MNRTTPLKRTEFKRKQPMQAAMTAPKKRQAMKSKQRPVTAQEKAYWIRLASLGCIACMIDHVHQPEVSIHHIDGRTKPGCHMLVLPLCGPHHQHRDDDPAGRIGVHPYKTRFEARYGTQEELMARCAALLEVIEK